MKKLSLLLAILFVFGLLPINANAAETVLPGDDIFRIAMEVFPEYAENIKNPSDPISTYSTNEVSNTHILVTETRSISETEQITYQEYSDGTYMLTFTVNRILTNSSAGTGYATRTIDIQVNHSYIPGAMYITGLTYNIVQNGYDCITSVGTTSTSTVSTALNYQRLTESATLPAYVQYVGTFEHPDISIIKGKCVKCYLDVTVGDDTCTVTAYGELVENV